MSKKYTFDMSIDNINDHAMSDQDFDSIIYNSPLIAILEDVNELAYLM